MLFKKPLMTPSGGDVGSNVGTPANDDHQASPKRVTIVDPQASPRGGSISSSSNASSPVPTPRMSSNRNGQPPNIPSALAKNNPPFTAQFAPGAPVARASSMESGDSGGVRSRSVERDLQEFVRECSQAPARARQSRARSVANALDEDVPAPSAIDAIIADVIHSAGPSRTPARSGKSVTTSYEPQYSDLSRPVRGRSSMRDLELDRLQRDVTSLTHSTRAFSATREFTVPREFSAAREFARAFSPMSGRGDFGESAVSKVYVSNVEPLDKLCMKVRAAIQREVTMMNKRVDLVWNKIQTLKETNDIMEDIICQTEDELCYSEELTDAVGLDLADILSESEERENLLNYEMQLFQNMKKATEAAATEDAPADGAPDPLQQRSTFKAMKKKAQKKFTRRRKRESEDIMNSTKCKIS